MRPTVEIDGIRVAQERLARRLDTLAEATIRAPSRLPGWSVAHVLAHLGSNGASVVRRLQAVVNDVMVDQYPGGADGRTAEIEQHAALTLDELVDYVRSTSAAVEQLADLVPDDAWDRLTRGVGGNESPARAVLFSRWREVEVHHVDLGLGYQPADWPEEMVTRWLPRMLQNLPSRADPGQLLAWSLGRASAPQLTDWG